uniref:EGF-like domain-containing protein n=1 Tax=Alexandrium monilatum TaxID=311494 RepID=A0A7S4WDK3_9DINO|mmetsp:Transcript_88475/g.273912  ORF Transcript_88475/g.273912 Transcript_88475/m.273912 type:complete len:386 (+) Transcript_88475:85-1242(+)
MGRPQAAAIMGKLLAVAVFCFAIGPGTLVAGARARRRLEEAAEAPMPSPAEAEAAEEEASVQDDQPPVALLSALTLAPPLQPTERGTALAPVGGPQLVPAPAPPPGPLSVVDEPGTAPLSLPPPRVAASFGLTPAPQPAPTLQSSGTQDVKQTVRFDNVNYHKLIASPTLLADFESAAKTQIAAQTGHGVTPDDIDLVLRPGSVVMEVTIHLPSGASAGAVQAELCSSSSASIQDLDAALSTLPGMLAASTGVISAAVIQGCGLVGAPVASMMLAAATTTQATAAAPATEDMDSCNPSCVPGQGICSDKICFCRTPFTGLRCEREAQASFIHLSYAATVGIAGAAIITGVFLGVLVFGMTKTSLDSKSTSLQAQGETWTALGGTR